MRPRLRITTVNLIATLLTCTFLAVSIGYYLILEPLTVMENNVQRVQTRYVDQQKQLIRDNVTRIVQHIELRRQAHLVEIKAKLKDKIILVQSVSASLTDLNLPLERHMHQLMYALNELPNNSISYQLINGEQRVIQSNATDNSSIKSNTSSPLPIVDSKLLAVVKLSRLSTGVQWHEPTLSSVGQNSQPQLSAAVYLPLVDCVIVVSTDLNQATRQLQRQLFKELAQQRYGAQDYGYYYVISKKNKMAMNAFHKPPFHDDLSSLNLSRDHEILAQELKRVSQRNGADFHNYDYHNPTRDGAIEEKLAYVAYYPPWDWTIGTGFYLNEHKQQLSEAIAAANKESDDNLWRGLWLLAANLLFGLMVALYINRHIRQLEKNRHEKMHELHQYKKLLDLSCMVSKSDLKGHITYTNKSFQDVTGYSANEMLGKPHNLFRHPSTPKKAFKELWDTIQAGKVWRGSSKNLGKGGKAFYTQQVIMPITDDNGTTLEYIAARYDITELLEKREQLQLAFSTDTLTALGSRFKLMNDIAHADETQCLALIDMDSFHGANKVYGTEVGDQLLKHIGEALSLYFGGSQAMLYRLNADIFGVLAPENIQLQTKISEFFEQFSQLKFQLDDEFSTEIPISLTAGIACDQDNLLTCADIALKEAKHQAQQVLIYDGALANSDEYKLKMYWIHAVQQALVDGRLVAYYQPIVDLSTGKTCKFETLMRLIDTDGKPVPPGLFLPILQQTHFYVYMTHAMIEQACAFFKDKKCLFSINFTVDDLLRKETVQMLVDTAQLYDVLDRLVLEVVETENIQNYDQALATIEYLKELGCQISIDDFGSGYSNFSYLTQVKADIIKIDGSLIQAINKDDRTRELITSIVQFAHRSQMKVVAEFIDSEEIAAAVTAIGCDYGQGYYYSPPVPQHQVENCPD
ncbi:MAG: EAL domain-containing protein [Deltaproteobacteria bacterium]|nr:EAL domain-containing protein [Deltaproteobacteria bacterium]